MTDERLGAAVRLYFTSERSETIAVIVMAAGLLVVAALLVWRGDLFARGLAVILALTALIAGGAAIPLVFRDAARHQTVTAAIATDPAGIRAEEGARLEKIIANYPSYRLAYAAAAGIALLMTFTLASRPLWMGIAAGLFVFAAIGLIIDHYSEARARRYALTLAR